MGARPGQRTARPVCSISAVWPPQHAHRSRLDPRDQARRLQAHPLSRRRHGAPVHPPRLRLDRSLSGDCQGAVKLRARSSQSMVKLPYAGRMASRSSTRSTGAARSPRRCSSPSICSSSMGSTAARCRSAGARNAWRARSIAGSPASCSTTASTPAALWQFPAELASGSEQAPTPTGGVLRRVGAP
jgi:hypothetical protein